MNYRREVDGLRAVAVLPVILFHGGFEVFSGGFVGVDVFFVISGYLVTTIILEEARQAKFSILTFYERRARRILPALTLVVLCCIPFAVLWMFPAQQRDFAQSLVSVFTFVSNFYFWGSTDYFAADSEELPLLHTWSLAVEEQYYLLFPLLLCQLLRFRGSVAYWVLVLGTISSLVLSEVASHLYPTANFYLSPTRAWELLFGSLCALVLSDRERNGRSLPSNELLAFAGLGLIAAAILVFDQTTRFPSLYALAPAGGAALIILFSSGTLTARLLSTRVLVGIGLISYSAYLWHQPLFAFARIRSVAEPPPALMLGISAVALLLAALSWRFVEQPFRRRRPGQRARVLAFSLALSVAFVAFGLTGIGRSGLIFGAFNDPNRVAYLNEQFQPNYGLATDCGPSRLGSRECRTGPEPVIAVWGDSYAIHLVDGIVASNPEVPVVQMTMSQCGPVLDAAPYSVWLEQAWMESCVRFNTAVLEWLRANRSVKYVVLSSPFLPYISEKWSVLYRGEVVPSSLEQGVAMFRRTLAEIESLGMRAVVIAPTPQTGIDIGRCLATRAWLAEDGSACDFRLDQAGDLTKRTTEFLERIATEYRVIWLADGMCPDGVCRAMRDRTFIYFDEGHLTAAGSRVVGREMGLASLIMQEPMASQPTANTVFSTRADEN